MASDNFCCFICGELVRPQQRFILHPTTKTNAKHRDFYATFMDPSFSFDSLAANYPLYLCRKASGCYSKLDAGVAKVEALSSIIEDLKGLMGESHSNIQIRVSVSVLQGNDNPGEGTSPRFTTDTSSLLGKRTSVQRAHQPVARKRLRMSSVNVSS